MKMMPTSTCLLPQHLSQWDLISCLSAARSLDLQVAMQGGTRASPQEVSMAAPSLQVSTSCVSTKTPAVSVATTTTPQRADTRMSATQQEIYQSSKSMAIKPQGKVASSQIATPAPPPAVPVSQREQPLDQSRRDPMAKLRPSDLMPPMLSQAVRMRTSRLPRQVQWDLTSGLWFHLSRQWPSEDSQPRLASHWESELPSTNFQCVYEPWGYWL